MGPFVWSKRTCSARIARRRVIAERSHHLKLVRLKPVVADTDQQLALDSHDGLDTRLELPDIDQSLHGKVCQVPVWVHTAQPFLESLELDVVVVFEVCRNIYESTSLENQIRSLCRR